MTENNTNAETNKYLFINLVSMLSITAMQQLGKIINPVIGKADVNLEAAQATIDTIDMLAAKTEGKLDKDEERLLKDTLATLKMNYVETKEMQKVACPSPTREGKMQNGTPLDKIPSQEAASQSEQPAPEKSEAKPEKEPPKFHKSYS